MALLDPFLDAVPTPFRGGTEETVASRDPAALARLLRGLEDALAEIQELTPQPADREPANLRRWMIRRNILPWDPLGSGQEGWVQWNGTAWQSFPGA